MKGLELSGACSGYTPAVAVKFSASAAAAAHSPDAVVRHAAVAWALQLQRRFARNTRTVTDRILAKFGGDCAGLRQLGDVAVCIQ